MIRLSIQFHASEVMGKLLTPSLLDVITRSAANDLTALLKNHFIDRAQATNSRWYWGQAAERTEAQHGSNASEITINQKGVRLHYLGGTVKPTGKPSEVTGQPTKSLLIPTADSPLAKRGVTLKELGVPNEQIHVLKSERTGTTYLAWIRPPQGKTSRSKPKVFPLGILVKQAVHKPDPSVLPTETEISDTIKTSAVDVIHQLINRK